MNITTDRQVLIFRNEYDNRVFYNTSLSKKNVNGEYENGNIQVQFKKDVDLPDQTKIYIRKAWLTFYKKKQVINGSEYIQTIPYIFINEFVTVGDRAKETHVDIPVKNETKQPDPFAEFGQEITITDADLPF